MIVIVAACALMVPIGALIAAVGINDNLSDKYLQPFAERQWKWPPLQRKVYWHLNYLRFRCGCGGLFLMVFSAAVLVLLAVAG